MSSEMTRREALKRAAWILGGTVSAPTIRRVHGELFLPESVDHLHGTNGARCRFRRAGDAAAKPLIQCR